VNDRDRVLGFCIGLGVGLGIGVLFAPKSGQEARSLIRDKTMEGAESVKRRGAEIFQEGSDIVKRAAVQTGESLRAAVNAGTEAYRSAVTSSPTS
jgi:gas vesicle protein